MNIFEYISMGSFLEAQLFYTKIDVKDSLPHSLPSSLALSIMSPFQFVDPFGRFLQLGHLEFDKEAIFDGYTNENFRYRCGFLYFK